MQLIVTKNQYGDDDLHGWCDSYNFAGMVPTPTGNWGIEYNRGSNYEYWSHTKDKQYFRSNALGISWGIIPYATSYTNGFRFWFSDIK